MNQINSTIIEGTVINDPQVIALTDDNEKIVKFTLANDRYYKKNGLPKSDTLFIVIQSVGEFGEKVLKSIKKGQEVRTCGRLFHANWFDIELDCSHIEYRVKRNQPTMEVL